MLTFDALLGYGRLAASDSRWVSDDQTWVSGERGGDNLFASIGLTAKFAARPFQLEPYVRADWIDTRLDAYREAGATDLALSYDGSSNRSESLALGLSLSRDIPINAHNLLTPIFSIQQQRTFNSNQAQTLYYTDIGPDLGYSISASAIPASLTNGHIGVRWRSRLGVDAELGMGYSIGNNSYIQRSYRAMLHAAF